jgi:tetratricopeptide (TPR) repeat protein
MTVSADADDMKPYALGQAAFERGQYREAIQWFQEALSLTHESSAMGGKIQIWLVTAYEAAGRTEEALTLCRQLRTHADYETRQQSKRLLYILEAPKLQLKAEWLTQIPELKDSGEAPRAWASGQSAKASSPTEPPWSAEPMEPIDPKESQGFLGLALAVSIGLLVFWWLSQSPGTTL